ncbi:type 2 isopentenyl-diphosphate Delta-isomerase [Bacillus badius]|uniref:Isopentenyl-diphosphate delta-isomerase n=1 Tax=Bacillus badius TaxID=1455 RepID=A0ABR5AYQ6_BACBA|nr:type 2 isopentenyl-diphosphate Delta-isomerase [Bacillus badius]KIL75147.1 Isopentenyl-diphosphate delta-isomerase, FMN-dependent [Bacillus badius]KIL79866.1 Isopentenyl-diphosphate delta-isomerase, FMN-dependent [Bacillus badius]MED4715055.1 type 2 isopentenyl-diphosphate Delta-isomerase [Bacillus badius]
MTRAQRKRDHIKYALSTGQSRRTGFDDIEFVHQSLPDTSLAEVSIQTKIGGLSLSSPIFINAMTGGGGKDTERINGQLAVAAREAGVAMAVGSQMSALKNPEERQSFIIVRKLYKEGIIFANLGSEATVEQAEAAVHMIEADALQIHLNVIQELTMPEGDRSFKGALERIERIAERLPVPVFVKETGFGLGREAAEKLAKLPVAAMDVSGFGGTNFAAVENKRRANKLDYFSHWGIPTAAAIIECAAVDGGPDVIASGGLQHSLDAAKSLALGAAAAGMAGTFLKVLMDEGPEALRDELFAVHNDLKLIMCAVGARRVTDLRQAPLIIKGETFHRLHVRGYEPAAFSQR